MSTIQNRKQFLKWMQVNNPELYRAVKLSVEGNNRLGAETPAPAPSIWDKIVSGVSDLAPAYLKYDQQRKIMDMQLQRARQGLPPADISQYSPTVKVGLGADLQKMLIPALLIGGAFVVFRMVKG